MSTKKLALKKNPVSNLTDIAGGRKGGGGRSSGGGGGGRSSGGGGTSGEVSRTVSEIASDTVVLSVASYKSDSNQQGNGSGQ